MTGERPSVLESTGDLMEWWVFPPVPEESVPTFSFEFVRDDGSGRLDHVHVEPGDVEPLIRFLGGVSLSDLQREIQTVRSQGPRRRSGSLGEELEGMYEGGYQAALLDLIDHLRGLGIDVERKD